MQGRLTDLLKRCRDRMLGAQSNGWHKGGEGYPRLAKIIQKYRQTRPPLMDTIFLWENEFKCLVFD